MADEWYWIDNPFALFTFFAQYYHHGYLKLRKANVIIYFKERGFNKFRKFGVGFLLHRSVIKIGA